MALHSMKQIFECCEQENKAFWEVVLDYDMEERQVSRQASMAKMLETWHTMRESADAYTGKRRSVSGLVGWVGLVTPHLCRKLVGSDHRHLLPVSMLFGAMFLLAVDGLARNLLATEIPIGILTALIGAPFFLYLITRKERLL